ncbi:MAG: peptidoglycan-binding protein [Bacillota bacterium]|nr:peptidoglycan-binding protein [Bacillota bacterium]
MTVRKSRYIVVALLFAFMAVSIFPGQVLAGDYGSSLLKYGSRGTAVARLQQDLTELGYSTYGVDGIFGFRTEHAVVAFQDAKSIQVDGLVGNQTKSTLTNALQGEITYVLKWGDSLWAVAQKYGITVNELMQANDLNTWIVNAGTVLIIPVEMNEKPSQGDNIQTEMADWWTVVNVAFPRGSIATVTDVDTGITFKVKRLGGSNHADSEPLTADDATKMKKARGGAWSWTRRAIVVNINGRVFAASQNGMPHGGQNIYNNNFDGHFCIHFLNSRTHGSNRVDEAHQAAVHKAAQYTL